MKKLLFTLLLSFATIGVFSQFNIGLRGGISSSQVKIDETVDGIKITTGDNSFGYHVGIYTQFIFKDKFILMPELLFSNSGGEMDLSDGTSFHEIWNLTYNRMDIPVNFGVKFLKIFRVNAGPYAGILLSADARSADINQDVKDNYKNLLWGYQAGVGVDIWRLVMDVKYEGSFGSASSNNVTDPGTGLKYDPNVRPNQWILSVGFKIF